ncbi:MAG: hypothetical protein D6731_16550 [Planctomycetota bacterium]|nr:MAG: hypothetical protein D6731_16550 [Planctomycetota bacterium]
MSENEREREPSSAAAPGERRLPPASEKQLKFIRVLAEKLSLSEDELAALAREVGGEEGLDGLTVRTASELIDELKIQGRERGVDLDAQDRASDKQVGFIKSLKRRALLTTEEFEALLLERGGVRTPEELGKRDASAVIDALKELERQAKAKGGGRGTVTPPRAGGAPPPTDDDRYDDDVPF